MKVAVDKQSGADAGGQPEIQHVARTPARAPGELGDRLQPGVVVHQHRYVEMPAELGRDIHPGPRLARQRRTDHAGLQVDRPGYADGDADQASRSSPAAAEQVVEQRQAGREPLLPRGVPSGGDAVAGERPSGQVGEVAPDAFEGEVQTGGRAGSRVGPQEAAGPAVDLGSVDAGLRRPGRRPTSITTPPVIRSATIVDTVVRDTPQMRASSARCNAPCSIRADSIRSELVRRSARSDPVSFAATGRVSMERRLVVNKTDIVRSHS